MTTTLAQALSVSDQSITLFDSETLVAGDLLALGSEYCRVVRPLTATQAIVQRGVNGTQARAHIVGELVTIGVPEDFLTGPQSVPVFGDDTDVLTANGPSLEATYQVSGGSGGGDTVIVDGVSSAIRATVRDYTNSNPLAVVLTDTSGDAYKASGGGSGGDVNLTGINAVTPVVGNGVTGTGSLRVTVASDNTPFHTIIDTGSTTAVTGNVTVVQPTAASLNATVIGAGSAGTANAGVVTVQGIASMTKLLVTPDSVALPANQSVNVSQINAVTPLMGNGVTGTGSQRVTIASDNTPFHVINDASSAVIGHVITDTGSTTAVTGNVTVVQSTASSLNAAVVGTGTAGTAAGGVLTVQGVASMTKLLVTPDSVALPANQSVNVSQINAVTPLMGNGTTGTGSQRVTISSDNTAFSVNPLSATTPVSTMNSASANSGVNSAMAAVFDDVAPTSITENSFGFVRMSANRNQYATIRDAAGNERGLNVDANGAIAVTATNATAANLNAAVVGTGTAGSAAGGVLTIQGVASMTKLLVTPDSVALPANQSVNVAQMNGVTVTMGTGNSGTGVQRVVLATDQPQLTNKLLVTPDANSAINLAQVNGTTTVNGGSAAGILAVGGPNATNVAITGNPTNLGAQAVSSENAAVTTARQVQLVADLVGKLIVLPYANPENFVSGAITSAMTGTTTTSLIAAPASGLRNYITQITVSNGSTTVSTDILIQDGSGGTTLYVVPCPAAAVATTGGGGGTFVFPTPLRQPTTATAIFCANVTTGSSTKVSASGYKGA